MTDVPIVDADFAVEFAGPEWFDLYQKVCIAAARAGALADGVTCEVYLDVPRHIAPSGTIAWTRRTEKGRCTLAFVECPDDEASSKIRADYTALLSLARIIIGEDERPFMARIGDALASGALEIVRHDPDAPGDHLVHNLMAAWTL